MATPNLVPRNDGEGSIGAANKRWAGGFFAGRLNSRGQTVSLKYFVSDAATRYIMSGMPSGVRPEDGDFVYQNSPPSLLYVIDSDNLGNDSGYCLLPAAASLDEKIDIYNGSGVNTTLSYGDVSIFSSGSGFSVFSDNAGQPSFNIAQDQIHVVGPLYLDGQPSGYITYINSGNQLIAGDIDYPTLLTLSGAASNIQAQIDALSGDIVNYSGNSPGGINLSIQYKDGVLFGGDSNFKFNKNGAFGYSAGTLRGIFDVRKPTQGIMSATGTIALTTGSGSILRSGISNYSIYPYINISGTKYYHTGCLSNSISATGNLNIDLSWPPQSGANGYRAIGSGYSNLSYELTGTGLVDSGQSPNASGLLSPNISGANLFLDYLSNLWLNGKMFINGQEVITTGYLAGYLSSGDVFNADTLDFHDSTYFVNTSQTGVFALSDSMGSFTQFSGHQINPSSSSTTVIDWDSGTTFYFSLSTGTTILFSGNADTLGVDIAITNTTGNYSVAWPTGIEWIGGTGEIPVQSMGNKTDLYSFLQINGTIYGNIARNLDSGVFVTTSQTGLFIGTGQIINFTYPLTSGNIQNFVSFPSPFSVAPKTVNAEFINQIDNYNYSFFIKNISTSGFIADFSDYLSSTGYQLGIIVKT